MDVDELLNTSTDMLLSVNCTLDMIKTILNYTLIVEPAVTENSTKVRRNSCMQYLFLCLSKQVVISILTCRIVLLQE